MSPTAEIKIKRYPEGWALHATWANDAGERRAIVRYRLGDAELVDETRTAVELIGLTVQPERIVRRAPYCGACSQVQGAPHARWCEQP